MNKAKSEKVKTWPIISKREKMALISVLKSADLSKERTLLFERLGNEWKNYIGVDYAIPCSSGTAALFLMLAGIDIKPGDEVIIPAFTWWATAAAIIQHQAIPIFVDIEENSFCLDPKKVQKAITSRTKAIIAVHLHGYPADMKSVDSLKRVAPATPSLEKVAFSQQSYPIYERVEGRVPDWEAWSRHLPKSIRESSLDYIRRRWAAWPAAKRRERAMNLLVEIKNLWNWFLTYRPMTEPGQIGLKDLWAYQTDQQEKGLAAGTINRRMDYVIGIIRELAEQDQTVDQSVFRIRYIPRPQSLPKHLSGEESQRLEHFILDRLTTSDMNWRLENAYLLVMLHSGLRAGECVDLRLQDLDLQGKRLIVRAGKGERDRLVYLSENACQAIQLYLQNSQRQPGDFAWLQKNGKPLTTDLLRKQVARIGAAAGIVHLHPHRLRHTCATRLLNAGMDIVQIQKLLFHEDLNTTMIYARVQDATVEADYRRFTSQIESQRSPLSNTPIATDGWPTQIVKVQFTIDNSV